MMQIVVRKEHDPWIQGSALTLRQIVADMTTADLVQQLPACKLILGWDPDMSTLGTKTLPEYLITDTIPFIDSVLESGHLDRFDGFIVAERDVWKKVAARYGDAWVVEMALPVVFSEDYVTNNSEITAQALLWTALRAQMLQLAAEEGIVADGLNMLQWAIYNKRNVKLGDVTTEIQNFLVEMGIPSNEFADSSLQLRRAKFDERYPQYQMVLGRISGYRNTGPFYYPDAERRIDSIVKATLANYSSDDVAWPTYAAWCITGKSNNPYQFGKWNDVATMVKHAFNDYKLVAQPYDGPLEHKAVMDLLASDRAVIDGKVAAIMEKWLADKGDNRVLNAQRFAYLATGNPDAEYVSYIIDNQDHGDKLERVLREIIYQQSLNVAPGGALGYDKSFKCINLGYMAQNIYKGYHRSGWQYVTDHLSMFDSGSGVIMDTYLDRTFHWNLDIMRELQIVPYKTEWIGFIHHTPDLGDGYTDYNTTRMFEKPEFLDSLPKCQGLIVLSKYLAEWTRAALVVAGYENVPVTVLTHPTETPYNTFNMEQFNAGKHYLLQVGGWLRDSFNIYNMNLGENPAGLNKAALRGKNMDLYFKPSWFDHELEHKRLTVQSSKLLGSNYSTSISNLLNPTAVISSGVGSGMSRDCSSGMSRDCSSGMSRDCSSGMSRDCSSGMSRDCGSGMSRDCGSGMSRDCSSGMSRDCGSGMSRDCGSGMSRDCSSGMSRDCSSGMSRDCSSGMSRDCSSGLGSGMSRDCGCRSTTCNTWTVGDCALAKMEDLVGKNRFFIGLINWLTARGVDLTGLAENGYINLCFKDWKLIKDLVSSVKILEKVSNVEYDSLLSESVVAIRLRDASAVNTIIECIVRDTPIVVNKIPAVVELLGEDYPLYRDADDDADIDLRLDDIEAASSYIKELCKRRFWIDTFIEELFQSETGQRCWMITRCRKDGHKWQDIQSFVLYQLKDAKPGLNAAKLEAIYRAAIDDYIDSNIYEFNLNALVLSFVMNLILILRGFARGVYRRVARAYNKLVTAISRSSLAKTISQKLIVFKRVVPLSISGRVGKRVLRNNQRQAAIQKKRRVLGSK
jgi:hypothetical protein